MSEAQVAKILWEKKLVLPKKRTQFYHISTYRELVLPENQSRKILGSLHFHLAKNREITLLFTVGP
jgi:hypothetical protein